MATVDKDEFPGNQIKKRTTKPKPPVPVTTNEAVPDTQPGRMKSAVTPKLDGGVLMSKDFSNAPKPQVMLRKESFWTKAKKSVLGEGASEVGTYVFWDVLIPAVKDTLQDIVTKGIEMLLFGTDDRSYRRTRDNTRRRSGPIVQYGSHYSSTDRYERTAPRRTEPLRSPGYNDRLSRVTFKYEKDARQVIEFLDELIQVYGSVSIADFYEAAGLASEIAYTDNSWGWMSLGACRVVRTPHGWEIIFADPERLD